MDSRLEKHRPDQPVCAEQGETVGGDVRVLQVELHVVAAGREPLEQEDHEGGRLYGNDTNLCFCPQWGGGSGRTVGCKRGCQGEGERKHKKEEA